MSDSSLSANAMFVGGDLEFTASAQVFGAFTRASRTPFANTDEFYARVESEFANKPDITRTAYRRFMTRINALRDPLEWEQIKEWFEELPHSADSDGRPFTKLPAALCARLTEAEDDMKALLMGEDSTSEVDIGDRVFAYFLYRTLQTEKRDFVLTTQTRFATNYLLKRVDVMLQAIP